MEIVALALGSNLGEREQIINAAYKQISETCGPIIYTSSMYETNPIGFESNDQFINTAILIETDLSPFELLEATRLIEKAFGREKKSEGFYTSRTLDIDIIIYGQLIMQKQDLTIPHPKFRERKFVLEPLNEIAPYLVDPLTNQTISKLLHYLKINEID